MLNVEDILTELDVLAFDSAALTTFGSDPNQVSQQLADKRQIAVDDWLRSALVKQGYSPNRHVVARAPAKAYGFTALAPTDYSTVLGDDTTDDLDLATVIVSPADGLFVASSRPFRALRVGMQEAVNVNTLSIGSFCYWSGGRWTGFSSLVDNTQLSSSISFSGGGVVSWQMPAIWQPRPLGGEQTFRYWIRIGTNQPPSSATRLTYLLPVVRSRLTSPAALYALSLLYGESWGTQAGEWREKATDYASRAEKALESALVGLDDEFVADSSQEQPLTPSDTPVAPDAGYLTTWERG